jgi:predicted DNA-binding transcriptional regulator AlpA
VARQYTIDGPDDDLLPLAGVLAYLRVGRTAIYELIRQGRFPRPQRIAGKLRWTGRDVACYREIADRLRPGRPPKKA